MPAALALEPDLVSLVGGGNDLLRPGADVDRMARNLEAGVVRLREAGVDVLLGTGVDAADSPLVRATRSRVGIYNALIWSMARRHGAYVVDLWGMRSLRDWRMWAEDRIHLTTDGHARVGAGRARRARPDARRRRLGRPAHSPAAHPTDAEGPRGRRLGARARLPLGDAAAAREVVRATTGRPSAPTCRRWSERSGRPVHPSVGAVLHDRRMTEHRGDATPTTTTTTVRGEDWYARDLSGQEFRNVEFVDLDLTESFGVGAVFEECVFRHAKLNASVHTDAAFMNCTFVRSTFFDVRFERCKLIGSRFEDCTWDIAKVEGGNWSFVSLAKADLHSASFTGVRLREADLSGRPRRGRHAARLRPVRRVAGPRRSDRVRPARQRADRVSTPRR